MIEEFYIPGDIKHMTQKYGIDKGGICGQSCLAIIENTSVQNILDIWEEMGIEFKGWSGWKQLKEYLEKRGFIVKLKRSNNLQTFIPNYFYILRIQWIGERKEKDKPFYGWGHWSEASAHTHFIIIHKGKFFCNVDGLFDVSILNDYLNNNEGVVTSGMEIKCKRAN